MSRSRKKIPIIKDNGGGKKFYKKLSHRRERVSVRSLVSNLFIPISPFDIDSTLFPKHRPQEHINQYDICDWKWSPIYTHSWAKTLTDKDIKIYYRK